MLEFDWLEFFIHHVIDNIFNWKSHVGVSIGNIFNFNSFQAIIIHQNLNISN